MPVVFKTSKIAQRAQSDPLLYEILCDLGRAVTDLGQRPASAAPGVCDCVPLAVAESTDAPFGDVEEIRFVGATVTETTPGHVTVGITASGSPLSVQEQPPPEGWTVPVENVTLVMVEGATVTEVSPHVAKITVPVPGGGGGDAPVLATDAFVATAAQTDFVLAHAPLAGGIVYATRDGVVARGVDWSLSGSTVTFGTGLDAGVEVQIAYWRTAPSGTSPAMESYGASEGQTDFPLSHIAGTVLVVAVNGIVQKATAWSIVGGSVLTFTTGLVLADDVWISYLY